MSDHGGNNNSEEIGMKAKKTAVTQTDINGGADIETELSNAADKDHTYENAAYDNHTYVLEEESHQENGKAITPLPSNGSTKANGKVNGVVKDGETDGEHDDDVDNDDKDLQSRFWAVIYGYTDIIQGSMSTNRTLVRYCILITLLLGYTAYLIYACIYDFDAVFVLLIITGLVVFVYCYILIRDTRGDDIDKHVIQPMVKKIDESWEYLEWPIYLILVAGIAVALYFLTRDNIENLISFAGLIFFIAFSYVFSKYPSKVKWRPVLWGFALQFLLGLFILRTYPGFVLFEWLSDVVFVFLNFSSAGSAFVFGDNYAEHYFAFSVLPIIIYFGSVISVLYYWGVMQVLIQKVAWLMERTMKTSGSESLNAAGNIFVGMTEAPLLIKPYLKDMTRSELHAVMTGGFATVAGSTLGAYILNGIDATHLITASVMSAPAALAISKLFFPETEQSKHTSIDGVKLPKGDERNVVEAAASGASAAIPLVLNIGANLIAFLSLLALVNALLGYFGGLVGYPQLTFEFICSYVFMPLAFIMGVEWADCNVVAELIGLKTFVNEFYAYEVMAQYIDNRETGAGPTLSERSEVIATYALCGFANIGSIGIVLGGLIPMAPERKKDMTAVAIRALVAGTVACFMTACIAGILYVPEVVLPTNSTAIPEVTTLY
ncbi:solute carrier family 28 member 3-like [Diadema setosum]|uniref:solute carrier family 28 member 3-like n=1 Tax=Diadema setosum TaxID=31175 RepID=UPI003B3B90A4